MGQVETKPIGDCVKKYNKFICTGDKADLEDCQIYYNEYIDKMNKSQEFNDEFGKCVMLNTKKEVKYIHSYNIDSIIAKLKILEDKLPDNYYKKFTELFDVSSIDNCCNCVSIVIYSDMKAERLSAYLPNVLVSLKNMEKHLPNWILRLYLDKSIFELIYEEEQKPDIGSDHINYGRIYRKILNDIFNHQNCEVFLSICDKKNKTGFNLSSLRSQRYHGFYDRTVNINASREADGFITVFDCHNLKTLETSDSIFFMYPFNRHYGFEYFNVSDDDLVVDINIDEPSESVIKQTPSNCYLKDTQKIAIEQKNIFNDPQYAEWHNLYKRYKTVYDLYNNKINHKEYVPHYEKFTILMPILAGLFALKCKLKSKVYYDTVSSIRKFIDVDFVNLFGTKEIYMHDNFFVYNVHHAKLTLGFDEILLMVLFEPIFGTEFTIIENQVILHKAKHIFDMVGLSMSEIECKKLDYNQCVDISDIFRETEICIEENAMKLYQISNYRWLNNKVDTENVIKLMCYDKTHDYEEYRGKFIYLSKYYMDVLNYGNQHIYNTEISGYNWFMSFYDIYNDDTKETTNKNKKYYNKYLKYKNKYLQLKKIL
jgi:hypothetical protein